MPLKIGNAANSAFPDSSQNPVLSSKKGNSPLFALSKPRYTLNDIVLPKETANMLHSVIAFYRNRDLILDDWGLREVFKDRESIHVNLYGEPGTGKTMAAHAIANALEREIILINYAEIESKYVGDTAKNIVSAFSEAKSKRAILVFDEADALLSKRVTEMTGANDVNVNQTKSVLLGILNDYNDMCIFTTNFIKNYDEAFMRRIHYHIPFHLPDSDQRRAIWSHYLPPSLPQTAELSILVEKSQGLSGSDIANAVFLTAVSAAYNHNVPMGTNQFLDEVEKIKESKQAQKNKGTSTISVTDVSEEYVKKQLGRQEEKL